jgi:beta-lactamase regulating signal transducer with metallopeptidase domain
MILSYALRLICLVLTVFAGLCAMLELILARCAPSILRRLDSASPRRRERLLYRIQLAPAVVALVIAAAACIPSYVRFEPTREAESVSGLCALMAFAAALWIGCSLLRGLRTSVRTLRFTHSCRRSGQFKQYCGATPVLAVAHPAWPIALLGFSRPLIIVSADLLAPGRLEPAAFAVALDHERSHALHRDNWKLLSLSFLPRVGLVFGDPWQPAWQAAADWAADDDAVRGDPNRSLLLAEALVRAARAVRPASARIVCTALTSAEAGLAARIDRLVHPHPAPNEPSAFLPGLTAVLLLATVAALVASPWIYPLSESLLHLGRF